LSKRGLTSLTVDYNEPVTGSAAAPALYSVRQGMTRVVKKHTVTVFVKPVIIRSITLGTMPNTVTIVMASPVKDVVQVIVQGSVTAQNGASANIDYITKL
jgi:hypothetical protein